MDDITTQFEEALRRHLRSAKTDSINYEVELAQLGLDSMTAVAVLLDMEKTFGIRFPDDMLVEGTFRTAGRLKEAVQKLRERKGS
jgi:acyl carrier protein